MPVSNLQAAVTEATRGTPYMVSGTDAGFDVELDVANGQWWDLFGSLTVSMPGAPHAPTEIPRADIKAISPNTGRLGNGVAAPVTEISYRDRSAIPATTHAALFGPTNAKKTAWLTVEQADLLAGLQAWKGGDPNDPGLMDRVEAILRGQAPHSV